jgi:pimeloyl-ACP methyl ester carboxylesterase
VVLLAGGLWQLSLNQNRASVRLARRLAAEGLHVLRFDMHGSGESTGVVTRYALSEPFVDDLESAVRWMRTEHGLERFALVGSCFGGRTCLSAASRIDGLEAVALFSTPLQDADHAIELAQHSAKLPIRTVARKSLTLRILKGLKHKDKRAHYRFIVGSKLRALARRPRHPGGASGLFLDPVEDLIERRIPVLLAYGTEPMRRDFEREMAGPLGHVLRRGGERVDLATFDIHLHGLSSLDAQRTVENLLARWVTDRVGRPSRRSAVAVRT